MVILLIRYFSRMIFSFTLYLNYLFSLVFQIRRDHISLLEDSDFLSFWTLCPNLPYNYDELHGDS